MITLAAPGGSASDYELVSRATFKTYANISGATDDSTLDVLVNGVNRMAHRELGGRFIKSTGTAYDQILDHEGGPTLWLPNYPVISVSLLADVTMAGNDTWTATRTYAATDYQLVKQSGKVIAILYNFPYGENRIRCTYTAGYATVPADLVEGLCAWIMVKHQRVKNKRQDAISVATGDEAVTFTVDDMPPATRRALDGYRYIESGVT